MNISLASVFADIPQQLPEELCQTLFRNPTVRIERILSLGHQTPAGAWYDQAESEWVILLQGQARISFADAEPVDLKPGDYLLIPAHCKHRVDWTASDQVSIWLAVHALEPDPNVIQRAGD
ncbi:cupin domain-containing protein [Methylomonas rapida]|jgi:Mannose-6-phosphate isomerase|uniref:Cupin domain-containing protein n=1 Tax=Methylomonas rapida TaxID=2963939 RepID=A0ABY7GM46_9GAMM|nr:cupin domain-containing protein [Methylomonas rapida]WAR45574.1 cupin domain-containing protein [Methylomonas rapida]